MSENSSAIKLMALAIKEEGDNLGAMIAQAAEESTSNLEEGWGTVNSIVGEDRNELVVEQTTGHDANVKYLQDLEDELTATMAEKVGLDGDEPGSTTLMAIVAKMNEEDASWTEAIANSAKDGLEAVENYDAEVGSADDFNLEGEGGAQ